ncbi:unnamed protein product, partial [Oppiella nova]
MNPRYTSDYLDIVYCPNNSYTNKLMEKAGDYFATKYRHRLSMRTIGVDSEQTLLSHIKHLVLDEKRKLRDMVAVDFGSDWEQVQLGHGDTTDSRPPGQLHYSLSITDAVYWNGDDYNNYLIQSQNRLKSFIRFPN